jgi:hypothetical protein
MANVKPRLDLGWRCAGLLALALAALASLGHRALLEAQATGPASALESVLALTSLLFASLGVLLLIHGRRLFRDGA